MTAKSNVIELNGRSYDALTGAMLGSAKRPEHRVQVASMPTKQPPHHASPRNSIDGFINQTSNQSSTRQRPAHKTPPHITAHHPQPTKTLMRRAVKAPVITTASKVSNKQGIQSVSPLKPGLPSNLAIQQKHASTIVDPMRSNRAAVANRNHLVKHFIAVKPHTTTAAPMQQVQPIQPSHAQPQQRPAQVQQTQNAVYNHPARNIHNTMPSGIKNTDSTRLKASFSAPVLQQTVKPNSYEDQDIFEQALAHATSHQERSPKESTYRAAKRGGKKHRRVLGFAAGLAAFVLMCGFVAYQNKANIQLQLASAKAGFSASLPQYQPDGYSLGKLAYSPGSVAMAFQNEANNSTFNVSQKKSNWDSQTLLDSFVVTSNQPYQGYESAGRTIYVYGQGKATWVNGGVWYQIEGADNLTSEQIVKVASSM